MKRGKKTYQDNAQGVRDCLKGIYQEGVIDPDIIQPDPWKDFVWIAIDTKKKKAIVVFLEENDAESVPYKGADYQSYL